VFTLTNRPPFTRRWLTLCILAGTMLPLDTSMAQPTETAEAASAQSDVRHYDIPAGPLAITLNRFAEASTTLLSADAALTRDKQSAGLHGSYSRQQALDILLANSSLRARANGDSFIITAATAAATKPARPAKPAAQTNASFDEITVTAKRATTATKTDTALVEIPQAISVIGAHDIESRGAIGVQEALRYTAGVRTEPNGSDYRFDYATARGGFEAADYIDGMHQPTSFYTPRTEAYTLERIEVLRGPSSVLYGQGSAGGLTNSVSKRPTGETGGEIGTQVGSFSRKQLQADLNGALNDDGTLAARVVGVSRNADNQVRFGKDDRDLIMPSLRWQPTDATDITLGALYQKDRAASVASFLPVNATLLAPPGQRLPWNVYLGEPDHNFYDSEQKSGSLLVTQHFSDALSFNSAVRYNRSDTHNGDIEPSVWNGEENPFLDSDNRILPRYRYDAKAQLDMVTTDNNLRFDFNTGEFEHKLLFGVDYLRSNLRSAFIYVDADPIDIYEPAYGNVPDAELEPSPTEINTQVGTYVQDQIRYADRVTLVLGARRDRAKNRVAGTPTQPDNATTYRAGLTVDVGANLSPYINYSESFQPTIGLDFYDEPFVPQEGKQREVGIKWQPDPGTMVTVSAFNIRGTNRLETDPENGDNQIQRGEVKSRGVELEASKVVADDFTVSASVVHVDAEINRSVDPLEVGLPLSAVPENQSSLWGEKIFRLEQDVALRGGFGLRHIGPSVEAVVFDGVVERLRTPGFTLADAELGVDWQRWSLSINATNLFDKKYYASCSVRSACSTGYRRNVIGTLAYKF